jgi:DNA-binding response OmpR family regulator
LKIYNLLNKKDVNNVVWRHKMSEMKILVVDDESRMRKLLKDFMTGKGYIVLEAEDGQQALDVFFANEDIKLVLLDVMMPKLDGWGVLKEIRQYSETPVIMLTAKADEQDELNGFNLGVDEYIAKPFSLKILSARIDAVLRRTTVSDEADLEADGIKINKLAHQVTVDGQIVELSVKEFELLSYFMLNRGIALSRNKILNSVWQYEYDGGARTIDTHVKKLRSKLGEKGKYITTIWGYGYKFECN